MTNINILIHNFTKTSIEYQLGDLSLQFEKFTFSGKLNLFSQEIILMEVSSDFLTVEPVY